MSSNHSPLKDCTRYIADYMPKSIKIYVAAEMSDDGSVITHNTNPVPLKEPLLESLSPFKPVDCCFAHSVKVCARYIAKYVPKTIQNTSAESMLPLVESLTPLKPNGCCSTHPDNAVVHPTIKNFASYNAESLPAWSELAPKLITRSIAKRMATELAADGIKRQRTAEQSGPHGTFYFER
jgi:hypothetical protein